MATKTMTIRLDDDVHAALKAYGEAHRRSMNNALNGLLREALGLDPKRTSQRLSHPT